MDKITECINSMYRFNTIGRIVNIGNYYMNLSNNDIFSGFIEAKINKGTVEIPIIMIENAYQMIIDYLTQEKPLPDSISLPIYFNGCSETRKTADSIVRTILSTRYSQRFAEIKDGNGDKYYGGRGIILNNDHKVLLYCTLECNISDTCIKVNKAVCHIDREAFQNQDNIVNKYLSRKFFNTICKEEVYLASSHYEDRDIYSKIKVVIEDIDNSMIIIPNSISEDDLSGEVVMNTIKNNKKEILNNMFPEND